MLQKAKLKNLYFLAIKFFPDTGRQSNSVSLLEKAKATFWAIQQLNKCKLSLEGVGASRAAKNAILLKRQNRLSGAHSALQAY